MSCGFPGVPDETHIRLRRTKDNENVIPAPCVIPAKAGIQKLKPLDSVSGTE